MARIAAQSYATSFAAILGPAVLAKRDQAFFTTLMSKRWTGMSVVECDDEVIAFALVTEQHLDMFFVAPERIGRGVGRCFLAWLEEVGVTTLECFRDNHAARRFYEREGWRLVRGYERSFIGKRHAFVSYAKPARHNFEVASQ
jgi:putative acetyltransferase